MFTLGTHFLFLFVFVLHSTFSDVRDSNVLWINVTYDNVTIFCKEKGMEKQTQIHVE